ncbi:MAG: hypothetical protein H7X88_11830 [Gloeobacteraceae cyanobacterium ES-bin-316]|nr:hypothetical protein [Ferruginibacter sp.]
MLFLSTTCLNIFSQQVLDSLLNELNARYPQEKIHMQLDKEHYNTGETLWFKAYIMNGNIPSKISTTLFAELINEQGAILQRKTMPVLQAGAASHFDLPDSTMPGKIFIRAYTSWMLNFDSTALFLKPVNMITAAPKKTKSSSYTLSLFPEGGDLVDNVESRVAFKTNDQDGKPFAVAGNISDEQGKILGSFKSMHEGMGYFSIAVVAGLKYKATWKDPAGVMHETFLPNAKIRSAALRIDHTNGNLTFTITRLENAPEELKEYVVLAQINQQTTYAARINLSKKTKVTAPIPIDSLPDGIMQVTIFNKLQEPVAERIVFINNNTYSFITDLRLAEKNISSRGKNVVQVDVGGQYQSNLSIAVTDAGLDTREGPSENIYSRLLLSADLKGSIYNPAYYFSSEEDSVKQQLDLVMMTNGWRRFKWQDLMSNKWPEIKYAPDEYLSISGNVFGLSAVQLNGKVLTGFLQASEKSGNSFVTIPVNKDGSFKLSSVYFFDTIKLHYQFSNDKNKTLTNLASFSFTNGPIKSPPASPRALAGLYFLPSPPKDILAKNIQQHKLYQSQVDGQKVKLLETVTVTGKKISVADKLDKEYASGLFSGGNSRIFAVEDDPFAKSAFSVLDYLRGKVAGLQISTDGQQGGSITRRGSETSLFLNETNTDISLLQSTPMSDVALIKVFDPPFFGSVGGGAGGAVAVYTKKGRSSNANLQGLNTATLQGYSSIKEFYMPNYDDPATTTSLADYRTTLYWNPFLLMDAKNRRVTLPFFNNKDGKKIRVVIEGLNEMGQLTREEKIFQ